MSSDLLSDDAARAGGRARWLAEGDPAMRAQLMAGRSAEASGTYGAIACGSPHATRVGMEVLQEGGTAADAAVAAALAMMVVDPPNISPAGRGHILWARAGQAPVAIRRGDGGAFRASGRANGQTARPAGPSPSRASCVPY